MTGRGIWIAALLALCCGFAAARGDVPSAEAEAEASRLCSEAIALAERAESIPRNLLGAIAQAESGRPVAEDRVGGPWPWTVTAGGAGRFFSSKEEAMRAAAEALAVGQDNVDVGCLQINLGHHPEAFISLEEAFDPLANAAYGAAFLRALFLETGSWPEAVGRYHSATPARNTRYRSRVLDFWNQGRGTPPRPADAVAPRLDGRTKPVVPAPQGAPGALRLDADALGELKTRLGDLAPRQ